MDMRIDQACSDSTRPFTPLERLLRKHLLARLVQLQGCRLTLRDALGVTHFGDAAGTHGDPLEATITVRDPAFYRAVAAQGSTGAGEAFIDGAWQCDDLVALIRILVRNRDTLDRMESGPARLGGMALRAWHALRRNTRGGSRRNIAAHYDIGNELFALFLDRSLMYSSAIYTHQDEPLDVAAERKLDRICRKLDLSAGDHVLEIGTGWGGFAIHAASRHGCRVTTTTISREQYELARQRVAEAGLEDRVTVLLDDYRDLEGRYDKLVSIEMIEAIGHAYQDTYFKTVQRLLKPDGLALIQAITIEDRRYRQARRSVDYIKRFIFPGSFIPCVSGMLSSVGRRTDLRLLNLEDIGPSYAQTLHAWRERFVEHLADVRALGYDERFVRMWLFYLAYCEGGFLERSIGDVQMLFARPGNRRPQWLPAPDQA